MTATTFGLVLLGAVLHALWNLAAKRASGGGLVFVWLFGGVSLALAAPVAIFVGLRQPPVWQWELGAAVLGTGLIHVAYSLVLQRGYREGDFSLVYPVARGTGPALSVVGAVVWLAEWPSPGGWAGVALILLGMGWASGLLRHWRGTDPRCWRGLAWGGLTGLCIAAYTLLDGWAVKHLGCPPVVYYALALGCRSLLLAPAAWRVRHAWRPQWRADRRAILTVGVLSPVAYVMVLGAMQSAPLSYVAPLREVSMLVGVWLGVSQLREAQLPSRMMGSLVMVCGVVVLAWA